MKITKIKVVNFLGVRSIDIAVSKKIVLLHGGNAAGKSSTIKAIQSALLGQFSKLNKKDYSMLLHNTESKGIAGVETDVGKFSLRIPTGNKESPEGFDSRFLEYVVDIYKFLNLPTKDRKSLIIELMNVKADSVKILGKLKGKGIDTTRLSSADYHNIEYGCDMVRAKLTELRGEWKGVTGETYGDLKAENWEPKEEIGNAEIRLHAESYPTTLKQLEQKEKSVQMSEETFKAAEEAYNELLRKNIKPRKKEYLTCVKCKAPHELVGSGLIFVENPADEIEFVPVPEQKLDEHKKSRDVAFKALEILREQAKDLRKYADLFKKSFDALSIIKEQINGSAERAQEIHKEIKFYLKVEKHLGPDGIQKEIIEDAIKDFNSEIGKLLAGRWLLAQLDSDCNIIAFGDKYARRHQSLLSESDEYKAGIMISAAIAHFSGLKFIVIDRIDMISPSDRGVLFGYLSALDLDTIICAGTMKEPLLKTPPYMQAHWIESGEIK